VYVRNKLWRLPIILVAAWTTSCAVVSGSGNVITESRNVSGFSAVDMSGDAELQIEATGTESLTVTADDNLMPYLRSSVFGSRLILDTREHVNLEPTRNIVYKLTVKSLDGVNVSGDGVVEAKGINSERLRISISGDGKVTIAGNAGEQEISISGDGAYQAQNLNSKTARVDISGDGKAILAVAEKLDANLSGDGSVEYIGNPAVTQHISGDGSIRRR
jgi:hypothetical protein